MPAGRTNPGAGSPDAAALTDEAVNKDAAHLVSDAFRVQAKCAV